MRAIGEQSWADLHRLRVELAFRVQHRRARRDRLLLALWVAAGIAAVAGAVWVTAN